MSGSLDLTTSISVFSFFLSSQQQKWNIAVDF